MSALVHHVALVSESQKITFSQVSQLSAALQEQVTRDFRPIWGIDATVDAFDKLESVPVGHWHVIIQDDIGIHAHGVHKDPHGQPLALVKADKYWCILASHETLEMLADPSLCKMIAGPPPPQAKDSFPGLARVVYLIEIGDPCQDPRFAYEVDGVPMSDFVTPDYYASKGTADDTYSFRGNVRTPLTVLEGGYVNFFDPVEGRWCHLAVKGGRVKVGTLDVSISRCTREAVDQAVRQNHISNNLPARSHGSGRADQRSHRELGQIESAQRLHDRIKRLEKDLSVKDDLSRGVVSARASSSPRSRSSKK